MDKKGRRPSASFLFPKANRRKRDSGVEIE